MKSLNSILMLVMVLGLVARSLAVFAEEEDFMFDQEEDADSDEAEAGSEDETVVSLRGNSRFLAQRIRLTCDKYPTVCQAKGKGRGKQCCNKKCVNVMADRLNCGACGKRCKFSEICCGGKCVNPSASQGHCGGCGNSCQEGSFCQYGMCSYGYA